MLRQHDFILERKFSYIYLLGVFASSGIFLSPLCALERNNIKNGINDKKELIPNTSISNKSISADDKKSVNKETIDASSTNSIDKSLEIKIFSD